MDAGISPAAARAAVSAALEDRGSTAGEGDPGEVALCREALRRKLRGSEVAPEDDRARARLARFLLGRGFSADAVRRALGLEYDPGA